jgi:hypothetical protein
MLVPPEFISQELKGKIFVPIEQLIDHHIDYNDSNTDWFTFGVLYHKQLVKNEAGKALMVFWLTDLHGYHFRMLLDSKAFKLLQGEEIGSVLGVLNSKIYKPSQRNACAALYINNPEKYVKLGSSIDLSWCNESGCEEILNKSLKSKLCDEHRVRKYKNALFERQEFAIGTSHFQIGPPVGILNQKNAASINARANYFLGFDGNLAAEGLRVKFSQPLEVTTQAASSDQM